MAEHEKFDWITKYGKYDNCWFETNHYAKPKNKFLEVKHMADYGPECIAVVSINVLEILDEDEIAIKNYSEGESNIPNLERLGIIGELTRTIPSGFVRIPVYRLTEKGMNLFKKDDE